MATLERLLEQVRARATRPLVIAIDGRSGAGKSTLAAQAGTRLGALVIDGDDFFAGGVTVRADSARARADACIDWREQARVLRALRAGEPARYHPFDWSAFDGSRCPTPTEVGPCEVIILEGVYSARRELGSLVDIRILLTVDEDTRRERLAGREGGIGPWEEQWHEAELWYFAHDAPAFDIEL